MKCVRISIDIVKGYNMRISQETLQRLNRSSIALSDGSGDHWGSLEVFHHLHCLVSFDQKVPMAYRAMMLRMITLKKTIRQYMAIDYYDPDKVRIKDKPPGSVYPTHIGMCCHDHSCYAPFVWSID